MERSEKIKMVLLGLITACCIVTAASVAKVASEGFEIVLTAEEVDEIVEAYEAARSDMEGER